MRQMPFVRYALVAFAALLLLAGCQSTPKPTVVELAVAATPNINPDASGRPSPVVVRIYQLASPTAFAGADFFQLYEQDAAVLGADLVGRDELTIAPGETRQLTREFKPNARYIGVLVAYRDIDGAVWQATAPVPPNRTTPMTAVVDTLAVSLTGSGAGS